MMTYTEVATGHDNSAGLQTVLVQPDYDGIRYPVELYGGDGAVDDDGEPFVELRFPDIVSATDWVAIRAQFGLLTAKSALITICLMDDDKVSRTVYNGRAVRKDVSHDLCWYKAPGIDVIQLEEVS